MKIYWDHKFRRELLLTWLHPTEQTTSSDKVMLGRRPARSEICWQDLNESSRPVVIMLCKGRWPGWPLVQICFLSHRLGCVTTPRVYILTYSEGGGGIIRIFFRNSRQNKEFRVRIYTHDFEFPRDATCKHFFTLSMLQCFNCILSWNLSWNQISSLLQKDKKLKQIKSAKFSVWYYMRNTRMWLSFVRLVSGMD